MTRNRLVFVSDIHIGVDAPTNWYQSAFHEPMLRAVFDWVIEEADRIAELILLGDVVDLWTYPPSVRPPSFADVAARHPAIFAPVEGAIARALTALGGAVSYVPGNHDMQVTAVDAGAIHDKDGRGLRFVPAFPYLPAAGLGHVACAHGHQYSIFNAPDFTAVPSTGLPVGHIITRLAALWTSQHLAANQTAADLPDSAEPTGWAFDKDELATLLVDVIRGHASLAELTIDALLRATGQPRSLPITLHDGTTLTCADAITAYAGLFERSGTTEHALFALTDCDLRNSLDHFARALGRQHKVVIFGHTHAEKDETQCPRLLGPSSLYVNSGFGCPSRPDFTRPQRPRRPSFVVVEIDAPNRRLDTMVHEVHLDGPVGRVIPFPADALSVAF